MHSPATDTRANRIPRLAPRRHVLYRRLRNTARRLYLEWLMHDLGQQLDAVEARRRDLRRHHARLATRLLAVRQELDNLVVQP